MADVVANGQPERMSTTNLLDLHVRLFGETRVADAGGLRRVVELGYKDFPSISHSFGDDDIDMIASGVAEDITPDDIRAITFASTYAMDREFIEDSCIKFAVAALVSPDPDDDAITFAVRQIVNSDVRFGMNLNGWQIYCRHFFYAEPYKGSNGNAIKIWNTSLVDVSVAWLLAGKRL
jgi:hypothetical protein